jgi:uncharacterized protein (TIGR03067 family)
MTRLMTAIILGVGLIGTAVAQDAAQALKQLQGTYTLKSGAKSGTQLSDEDVKAFDNAVIAGDTITITAKGKGEPAKLKVNPSKKPAEIDILPTRGKTRLIPGIYKLNNGELTLVYARGKNAKRPKDFDAKEKGQIKLVLVKKTEPKK